MASDPFGGDDGLEYVVPPKGAKRDAELAALAPGEPAEGSETDLTLAYQPHNDFGNANRLIVRFGDDLMYVKNIGWFCWDDVRWNREAGESEAEKRAHRVSQLIRHEAAAIKERYGKERETLMMKLLAWAGTTGNTAKFNGMLTVAQPYLMQRVDSLDADQFLLASPGGTIRLSSHCEVQPNDRKDRITRSLGVPYRSGATCPLFERFIEQIMPDEDMRLFLQRILGYCLTASTREQSFFIFYGTGSNGKSTLMNIVRHVMGDYAMNSPVSTFLAKRDGNSGSEASPDLARLPGARLVTAAEPPEGARLDEAKVKEMASGEPMTVRHLNQGFFEFRPVFKAIISTNHRPTIRGTDHGIWRRIRLVPFTVQIQPGMVDPGLEGKLLAEAPGILQWMLTGAEEWFSSGLQPPAKAIAAVEDYRAGEDPVGEFLKAKCELTGDYQDPSTGKPYEVSAKTLRAAYKAWCEEEGLDPLGAKSFGSKVIARGIATRKSHGLTVYVGVHLNAEPI
jgi:putative DNA primase/helicase